MATRARALPEANSPQGTLPLTLGTAAVHGHRPDPSPDQLLGQPVGSVTGAGKDDRRSGGVDHLLGPRQPIVALHPPEVVADVALLRLDGTNFVADRITLVVPSEDGDVAIERGRERQGLPFRRGGVEEAAHRREEAHIGHPVGFVHYHDVDLVQVDGPLGG